jgi:vacuolar-type H+-ATPase subunit H
MDVLVLIDKLDALVRNAKHVPLSSEVRVDREKLSDLLNELRETIPEELKEARWIVKEREEMLAAAEREAERILGEARERQNQLVVEHHLTLQAELAAEEIIDDARAEERETRLGAEDYADEILSTFETNLSKFIHIERDRDPEVELSARRILPPSTRLGATGWHSPWPTVRMRPRSKPGDVPAVALRTWVRGSWLAPLARCTCVRALAEPW